MTRKHYVLIAHAVKAARIEESARYEVAHELAYVLREDNNHFDKEKFLKACGVTS